MVKNAFLCILLFSAIRVGAQLQKIDSLINELSKHKKEESIRLETICNIAHEYQYFSTGKGFAYADTAISLAKKIDNQNGLAHAYRVKGENYYRNNDYKTAWEWYQQSQNIYVKTGNKDGLTSCLSNMGGVKNAQSDYNAALGFYQQALDLQQGSTNKTLSALVMGNMGLVYSNLGDYPKALSFLEKAIKINENLNNEFTLGFEYNNTGGVYLSLSNYTTSLEFYQKALRIYEHVGNKSGIASASNSISSIYINFSNTEKSLEYANKALNINLEIGDSIRAANSLFQIGVIYSTNKNYGKASEYYQKAMDIYDKKGINANTPNVLNNLGFSRFSAGDYNNVLPYYKKGLRLAQQLNQKRASVFLLLSIGEFYRDAPDSILIQNGVNPTNRYDTVKTYLNAGLAIAKDLHVLILQRYAWEDFSIMYEKQKEYLKALDAYKKFIVYRDSIFNDEKEKRVSRLSIQYEYDKKADSIKLQEQITDEQLKQQMLLAKQQHQELELGQRELALITKEKDLQKLAYLKTQADLKNEQLQKQEKDKQLVIVEKEKKIQQADILKQQYVNRVRLNSFIGILAVFLVIAMLLWRNNLHKQKANALLLHQKNETLQQKIKAETALEELTNAQNQLIQREKMASLGELTAGIAHEIQNPLNFVNNFSDVSKELIDEMNSELENGNLEEAKYIAADIKQNLSKINHHGKRADSIVRGMLQHSNTSTGQKELTNINKLVDEYVRISFHGVRSKDKEFTCEIITTFDDTIGRISVIPQEIGRVILNLVNNAFYAVNEKTKQHVDSYAAAITITTKKTGNKMELTIADNGNGISEKIKAKIFQPFFTTKPTGQGTGLGLSLTYEIVKAHGGEINLTSTEGQGSSFVIQLPG